MMNNIQTYQSEPISNLLIGKWKLSGGQRLLLYVFVFGIVSIVLSAIEGNLVYSNKEGGISYIKDFSTFYDFLILNPLIIYLIQKYFIQYSKTIESLAVKNIVDPDSVQVLKEIKSMDKYFKSSVPLISSIIVSVSAMSLHVANISKYEGYFIFSGRTGVSLSGIYILVMTTVYIYFLLFSLQKLIFLIRLKRVLFKQQVKIELLHEDRCGGLKKIGMLCMTLNYSLFLLAITLLLFVVADMRVFNDTISFRVLLVMPLYIIGAPCLFFYPLIPIHKKMEVERSRHLEVIGQRFELNFAKYRDSKDSEPEKDYVKNMRDLQEIFTWIEKIPKWPIDTRTYAKFTATILIPLIVFILQLVSKFTFSELLKSLNLS